MSQVDPQEFQRPQTEHAPSDAGTDSTDNRTPDEKQADKELAERLSSLIEDANSRVVPLTKMIRKVSYFVESRTQICLLIRELM